MPKQALRNFGAKRSGKSLSPNKGDNCSKSGAMPSRGAAKKPRKSDSHTGSGSLDFDLGNKVICWFRQDLRVSDNPSLVEASKIGTILPVFILDEVNCEPRFCGGGASKWWLYHSLKSLNASLNGCLSVYKGDAVSIMLDLCQKFQAVAVLWNKCYEPWRVSRDATLEERLTAENVHCASFNGSLLWEPTDVLKSDGTPYKVFTPYYRNGCLSAAKPRAILDIPKGLTLTSDPKSGTIDSLDLLTGPKWYTKMEKYWNIGEQGAQSRLETFLRESFKGYKQGRDIPSLRSTSRLSPHLHFGEISPNQVWFGAKDVAKRAGSEDVDSFLSEIGWREFSYYLLYHFPQLPTANIQAKFDAFPWRYNADHLKAWQKGRTGIPIVDAGMRELWETGWMHNRVRMIVASFLVKNLQLDWREGERWFWDCLVDADLASNAASWQWVAGCGFDAAPYFRVFNPVLQGEKFDNDGTYIKQWVPELVHLPPKHLFAPWAAPQDVLRRAGVTLGKEYPRPLVDLKRSREEALAAFKSLKSSS